MTQYNMLDAKNNLSKICKMLINKEEDYVIIASNGKPVAKIIPYVKSSKRVAGCLKNKYKALNKIDWFNNEITELFLGEE